MGERPSRTTPFSEDLSSPPSPSQALRSLQKICDLDGDVELRQYHESVAKHAREKYLRAVRILEEQQTPNVMASGDIKVDNIEQLIHDLKVDLNSSVTVMNEMLDRSLLSREAEAMFELFRMRMVSLKILKTLLSADEYAGLKENSDRLSHLFTHVFPKIQEKVLPEDETGARTSPMRRGGILIKPTNMFINCLGPEVQMDLEKLSI